MKLFVVVAILLSICGRIACSAPRRFGTDDREMEMEMAAQWAAELTPGSDGRALAERIGMDYEGAHPTLANIHLFRVREEHRTRDLHSGKIQEFKRADEVVWSEIQLPRDHAKKIIH